MAESEEKEEDLCCIEASVVTGFEECARGEAKEKFGVSVHAARGKITWKVPINRVKEVVKMGSIDNCRVIVHSIPHFKFSSDQHNSLASLQKMVPDMAWEKGLCVWRQFFEFPYPISSMPDVIPSPEDLVDVVIIERKHVKDPNARRNNKKPVRGGKKKDKRNNKDKKNIKPEDEIKTGKGDDGKEKGEKDKEAIICNDNQNATVDHSLESETYPCRDCSDEHQNAIVSEALSQPDVCEDAPVEASNETLESEKVSERSGGTSKLQQGEENLTKEDEGRTRVIIKRADPSQPQPKIEVKVLIPGPSENVFPAHLDEKDHRDLEPMDVDLSMNVGNESKGSSLTPNKEKLMIVQNPSTGESSVDENCIQPPSFEDKENHSENKSFADAEGFASDVIEKLKSSSPIKIVSSLQEITCKTPPSTPVILPSDPLSAVSVDQCLPMSSKEKDNLATCEENSSGSSVDPPSLFESCRNVLSTVSGTLKVHEKQNVSEMGKEILMPPAESLVTDAKPEGSISSKETLEDSSILPEKKEVSVKKERDPTKPTFRVTCHRTGDCHTFDSSSAAASLGSAVIKYFNWGVDLKNFDIEILLNIDNEEVTVGIALTKSSLHNRNLVAFGPTTLRATICYNMLRLCRIKIGDIVCDPLCGTSALPIEGALNWVNSFHFGGDYHELAMERSVKNMAALREEHEEQKKGNLKIGLVQWNLNSFPLRDKCVDVFVSDLPFGYRMGSRTVNRTLYPTLLSEMARTGRPGARSCLLTEDKTSLIKAIQAFGRYWQRRLILNVNMGGLSAFVFLLTRTSASFTSQGMLCGSETESAPNTAKDQGKAEPPLSPKEAGVSSKTNSDNETTVMTEQDDTTKKLSGESDGKAPPSKKSPEKEDTVNGNRSNDVDSQNASVCGELLTEGLQKVVIENA